MYTKFKKGSKVIVNGPGKKNGKIYRNAHGKIIERDVYYKDYHVRFFNGTDDWFLQKHLRKPYSNKRKERKL